MKRKTLALVLGSALTLSAGTLTTQAAAPDNYNLEIQATLDENGEVSVQIHNANKFVVGDLNLSITHGGDTPDYTGRQHRPRKHLDTRRRNHKLCTVPRGWLLRRKAPCDRSFFI